MKVPNNRNNLLTLGAMMLVVALLALLNGGARGGEAFAAQASPAAAQAAPPGPSAEALHLLVGRSLVISSQARIFRISVADPAIVDALAVSPTQILISGKSPGVASLVIWDETGQSQTFDAYVDMDVTEIVAKIHQVLPNEPVEVEARGGVITLSGLVSSQAVADHLLAVAQAMSTRKDNVISLLQVPVPKSGEVLLEVKFADVDRSTLNQLGANILSTSPAKTIFSTTTGEFAPPTVQNSTITGATSTATTAAAIGAGVPITVSQLLNVFVFRSDINLGAIIQALEQKNLLQLLAEPNVLAETGKEASFLAGGQFPFPVVQGSTGVPVVTIQFRDYGIKLSFTPVITPEGLIHLKVAPEVSSLDYTNALTYQGFTIPSLSTRSVQTEMILKDGQSFVIAGLVNDQVTEQFSKVPGLGDLPILGALFKSRSISKSKDELLVMVTPHIVRMDSPPKQPPLPQFPDTFLKPLPASKDTPPSVK
ncbi:MAG TPA: pilus assembly protein N-terminal domain-containing protein [Terriglobia bacterium]|nr:pilus assembly protein N-terminal domain-containing protein [Terriglobia bacterium]